MLKEGGSVRVGGVSWVTTSGEGLTGSCKGDDPDK
jgi:hypothetical protein